MNKTTEETMKESMEKRLIAQLTGLDGKRLKGIHLNNEISPIVKDAFLNGCCAREH